MTVVSRKYKFRAVVLSLLLIGIGYFIQNSDLFEATFQKIDETEIDENARLINGLNVVSNMPIDKFFLGVNNANVSDYVTENHLESFVIYESGEDHYLFIATLWQILIRFGIPGLLLYIFLFYSFFRKDSSLLPYLLCIAVGWFFQGIGLSIMFSWQVCIMASYIYRDIDISHEFVRIVKESYSIKLGDYNP